MGRLKQDRWNDGEGKSHNKVKIVAEHVEFKPQMKDDPSGERPPSSRARKEEPAEVF